MTENTETKKQDSYTFPWLVFKLMNCPFAVNCETITSITILPENITRIPHMPDYMRGILNMRGSITPLLDMRSLFGMVSLKKECDDFSTMIEAQIEDHRKWVAELERCIETKEDFTFTTDPHKCDFGVWYDSYKAPNNVIGNHLKKIDSPHKKLHAIGSGVKKVMQESESSMREKQISKLLTAMNREIVPELIDLLEDTPTVFKESFREMIVVLEYPDLKIGILVDEVLSVDQLTYLSKDSETKSAYDSKYVKGVGKSAKMEEMILLIDEETLGKTFKASELETIQNYVDKNES